jgi:protein-tyrosine phosphatase
MNTAPALLLVCMGNICRSPLAEGILRKRAEEHGLRLDVDSAGTHAYHVGQAPDPRARQVARERGVCIDDLRARQVTAADFQRFDWLLVADRQNQDALRQRFPEHAARIQLLLAFAGLGREGEVPDPYYGDYADFVRVFDLLDQAAPGVLQRLRAGG